LRKKIDKGKNETLVNFTLVGFDPLFDFTRGSEKETRPSFVVLSQRVCGKKIEAM
jgi:hypothetical protein